ncbi:MAG: ribonuclease activity regulator RraA [Alphaproteobacteria bacterium]|nr:ribonuclease activity regulator RraA [Alphaproteobacteria bacterium]MDP6566666.1 ribonuclease activity regulator RraA [Alphaproteobacteria bacterium]MDP6813040.1 ribonuclease activity regulator RraA [Alphaproteobacteria bacterium]
MTALLDKIGRVGTATLTTQLMQNHGLFNASIRGVAPVNPKSCRFAGPAYTLRYLPLREDLLPRQHLDHPDNRMRPAVESMPAGAVLMLDGNGRRDVGMLGGNLAMRLKQRGIAGVVTDGGMRDLAEIAAMELPMFAGGPAPPPSFAKLMIVDGQCPVAVGGVTVFPGDIVVGDGEGVVVVPAGLAEEVAEGGLAQDHIEGYIHRRLAHGEALPGLYPPSAETTEAYRRWVDAGEPDDF